MRQWLELYLCMSLKGKEEMDKKQSRKEFIVDILLIVASCIAVFLSILVFLSPSSNPIFFSFIFIITSIISYTMGSRDLKIRKTFKLLRGSLLIIISVFLFIMAIVSIITL